MQTDILNVEPEEETNPITFLPNPEQEQAINDFFEFMLSENKEYHLTGGAGVGKTFTLDLIMSEGMNRYVEGCKLLGVKQTIFDIALTATTNKAAAVLSVATGKPASTIHSYMGFKVREDYSTGETKITVPNGLGVKSHTLIIIDEASMIDHKLYDLLHKYTHKCKFLYVGDHCQMAPVFEKLSKIYNNKEYFSNLIRPMRNSGQPALMNICTQLRETVETGIFKPIQEVPGVIDYISGSQFKTEINKVFIDNNPNARILCFRNSQVKDYNQYIRNMRGLPSYYEKDEVLVSATAISTLEYNLSIEQEVRVIENKYKEIEKEVQGVKFDVYEVVLSTNTNSDFTAYIPSNADHFAQITKYFANQKNWSAYFHLTKNYPDLRLKDASTVYKAQGSTYHTVYVDLSDISLCKHKDQVARMLYVAASRPQQRLALYGQLKPAYRGA